MNVSFYISMIIFAAFFAGLLFCVWGLICNHLTCEDRLKVIQSWPGNDYQTFQKMVFEFDQVSYEDHMWARVWLRDPRKLYGPITRAQNHWT